MDVLTIALAVIILFVFYLLIKFDVRNGIKEAVYELEAERAELNKEAKGSEVGQE